MTDNHSWVMKVPFRILVMFAAILWMSAFTMFAIGVTAHGSSALRLAVILAAIPDAVLALVFTVLAAQKWAGGSR